MPIFYIYHIPGRKVGCTTNLEKRKIEYEKSKGKSFPIPVLQVLVQKTPKEAGDAEWAWADYFGYRHGNHYEISYKARVEIASEAGKKGGLKGGPLGGKRAMEKRTLEQRQEYGRKLAASKTPEERIEFGRRLGLKFGYELSQKKKICPHCGWEGNIGNIHMYHLDKCKKKPFKFLSRPS